MGLGEGRGGVFRGGVGSGERWSGKWGVVRGRVGSGEW